jgi:hypothetical protein
VVVRDDVAGLVDHEAGADGRLLLRRARNPEEGVGRRLRLRRRRDVDDTRRIGDVDIVDRPARTLRERRGLVAGRARGLANDRVRRIELPQRSRAAEHDHTTRNGSKQQLDGAATVEEGTMHLPVLTSRVLTEGCGPLTVG